MCGSALAQAGKNMMLLKRLLLMLKRLLLADRERVERPVPVSVSVSVSMRVCV